MGDEFWLDRDFTVLEGRKHRGSPQIGQHIPKSERVQASDGSDIVSCNPKADLPQPELSLDKTKTSDDTEPVSCNSAAILPLPELTLDKVNTSNAEELVSSDAEGNYCQATGDCSHAGGRMTVADSYAQTAIGQCNVRNSSGYFVVGKGTAGLEANCFRVTPIGVFASGNYASGGADYAELFEWLDGNPEGEDRVGRFVTLEGERLRPAGPEDEFILGIVSGNPSVLGNVHDDQWHGMYLYDIYGRALWEDVEVPDETAELPDPDEPGQTVTRVVRPARTEHRQRLNPDYDSSRAYLPRTQRPEWACVGMMGVVTALDDGSCEVDGWCAPSSGGVATASGSRTKYRVLAQLDESHVRVLIL